MIVRNKGLMADPPPAALLNSCWKEFQSGQERLKTLDRAWRNDMEIMDRVRESGLPNNRLSHAYAGYITAMASGYLLGEPVKYSVGDEGQADALKAVTDAYKDAQADAVDEELAEKASIYGRAVEIVYADENAQPRCAAAETSAAFVVYDDTVAHKSLFGMHVTERRDVNNTMQGYDVHVYTQDKIYAYQTASLFGQLTNPVESPHYFGGVPMVEYWNNSSERGDFEPVLTEIGAYNILQSDRVNEKEQQVNGLLVITGARIQNDEDGRTPAQQLREDKILFLPDMQAKAEYLSQGGGAETDKIVRDDLNADIHKFSLVPDMSDEKFSGNTSGVAIRYKLLGLEMLMRKKERWFRQALEERMRLFAHFLAVKGGPTLNTRDVKMTFTRALPANLLELSQTVQNLSAMVPEMELLKQIPFVEDTEKAAADMAAQRKEALKLQAEAFAVPRYGGDDD